MNTCKIPLDTCKLPIDNYNSLDNNDDNNWSRKKYCYFIVTLITSIFIACKLLYYLLFDILLK
jgi:hypothetical protein